jgi:hypothetical protein
MMGTATGVLSTNSLLLSSHEIFLAWGIRSDPNLPLNLLVVRQDSSDSYY